MKILMKSFPVLMEYVFEIQEQQYPVESYGVCAAYSALCTRYPYLAISQQTNIYLVAINLIEVQQHEPV